MRAGVESVYIDDLTGVLNRRYLYDHLKDEVELVDREGRSLWMAVIDIDDFKAINDTYGHLEGDNILREVASIFRRSVRASDKVIRFGGDEFIILLIDGGLISALTVLKRIRENISRQRFSTGIAGLTIEVTISIGLAGYPDDTTDPDRLLSLADEALYIAKNKGKAGVALVSDIPAVMLLSRDILELFPAKEIVERDKELEQIKEFVVSKDYQVLGVTAPFGLGKTRILKEAEKISSMYSYVPFFATTYGSRYPLLFELWRYFESNYLDIYPDLMEILPSKSIEELKELEIKDEPKKAITIVDELLRHIATVYPIMFIVDDLLYADEDSLWSLIRFLHTNRTKSKLLFSLDSDVEEEKIRMYLELFESRFPVNLVSLSPLSLEGVKKWLGVVLSNPIMDERIKELLHRVSHGNPMFLEEILKYLLAKKLVYRVNQNWIFRSYEEIESEIDQITFSDLVRRRARTLDEILIKEITKLRNQGESVSNIWKMDIGVVRKGYLLDIVKAFHREKLLQNRHFYVEDYPNVAVEEIVSVLEEGHKILTTNGTQRIREQYELVEHLMREISRRRGEAEDTTFIPLIEKFLTNLAQIRRQLSKAQVQNITQVLQVLPPDYLIPLNSLFSKCSYLEVKRSHSNILVNEFVIPLPEQVKEEVKAFLSDLEVEKITFLSSVSKPEVDALICLYVLNRSEMGEHILLSPNLLLNEGISVTKLKDTFLEILSWKSQRKSEETLREMELSCKLAYQLSFVVDKEDSEVLRMLRDLFSSSLYLYRMWILGVFLLFPIMGIPKLVRSILEKMPEGITAEQLTLMYQHRMIPIQFIKAFLRNCFPEIRENILAKMGEDLSQRLEEKVPDSKSDELLSISDIDRWGTVIFGSPEELVAKLSLDVHMLNLVMDSFEMSFGDLLLLFEIAPAVPVLIKSLYSSSKIGLARKLAFSFLESCLREKEMLFRIVFSIKRLLLVLLEYEQDSRVLLKILSRIKRDPSRVYKQLHRDVEVTIATMKLVNRFFHHISEGSYDDVDLVKSIFIVGNLPMRNLLNRLVFSEDISSFGYFDLFLARRIVGSNVPPERKEEVILFLSSHLDSSLWYVVRNAMELLSYIISPNEVGIFRPLIYHQNSRIRKRLVSILARVGGREAERILLEMLKVEKDKDIQDRIYSILKRSKNPEVLEEISELI